MLEYWSAGVLKIRYSTSPLLRWRSSRCILRDLSLRRERRVTRRPYTSGASELNCRRFAVSRCPEYPFPWMFFLQCCRQPQLQHISLAETKLCRGFTSSSSPKTSGRNSTPLLFQTIRYGRRSITLRSCAWCTRLLNPSRDCFSRLLAMTPVKLGTASISSNSRMKMDRAISINVNARKRCTAEVTRSTQNHNRTGDKSRRQQSSAPWNDESPSRSHSQAAAKKMQPIDSS